MWTVLVVSLVCAAPPAKDAAKAGEDRDVKILAHGIWAMRHEKPAQLVIRSAEELARAHGVAAKDAKEKRFQTDVTADVAQLLKVKTIDWDKQMLVVVAAGSKPTGGYRVEVRTLSVKDKTLTVHWKLHNPAPGGIVTTAITYPAQMVLVERFDGPVKFDPPVKDK
jgi:hypothetical protein